MSQGLFITGTDTGIGKTIVSKTLIRYFCARGEKVIGMKPVASGATVVDDRYQNDDAIQLLQTSNVEVDYELANPYCFEPPIAPHIASQRQGVSISLRKIKDNYQRLTTMADRVVVEGVGGWQVPLNDSETVADMAADLNLPVVLVVGMRLGCINHALLSVESIARKGCNLIGWVANCLEPEMDCLQENISTLENILSAPKLFTLPWFKGDEVDLFEPVLVNNLIL